MAGDRRDRRPVLSVVIFMLTLIICAILLYAGDGYEEACRLCGNDEWKASCNQGGLHFISYTGTLLPEQVFFTTGFIVSGTIFATAWLPMSTTMRGSTQQRSLWRRFCGCGCGLSIDRHTRLAQLFASLGYVSLCGVGIVSMKIDCFTHFLFATLTYVFLSLWTVTYTALEFRLLPESESTPFHLKIKLANCYTFLLVFGYYGLAGFVTKGTYQLRDYRTLAASAQWLLATNLVTVLLSEHWNPRFGFGQSKSVSREIKQTVPADEADADADADAPPPATPPAAEQLSNTVTHVASV